MQSTIAKEALTKGLVLAMLAFGGLVLTTPKDDYLCQTPRRLAVKPGEFAGKAMFCVVEVPISPKAALITPDKSTGVCADAKVTAERQFQAMALEEEQQYSRCVASRASPPEATWRHARRLLGLVD